VRKPIAALVAGVLTASLFAAAPAAGAGAARGPIAARRADHAHGTLAAWRPTGVVVGVNFTPGEPIYR
jgi:hypothetical protein